MSSLWRNENLNPAPSLPFDTVLERVELINNQALADLEASVDSRVIIAWARWQHSWVVDLADPVTRAALNHISLYVLGWEDGTGLIDAVFQLT